MTTLSLPKFSAEHQFDGSVSAARWLDNISFQFEVVGHTKPPPALMLRVINMLCTGEAAEWIDSTPRVREEIADRLNATDSSVAYVKSALEERFPGSVSDHTELSVQSEVENLRQGSDEPLAAYYSRTAKLLNRIRGRDRPRSESTGTPLTGPEEFTLTTIITAYTRGLYDEGLRKEVVAKSGAISSAFWRCQEIVLETQRTILLMKQYDEQAAQSQELEKLRDLVLTDYGQPASVILAAKAESRRSNYTQGQGNFDRSSPSGYGTRTAAAALPGPNHVPSRYQARPQSSLPPQDHNYQLYHQHPPQQPTYQTQHQQTRGGGNIRGRGGFQNSGNWRETNGPKQENNPHPPRSSSTNAYVNMSANYDKSVRLCVGCGEPGHVKPQCKNPPLQLWEQAYLKQMVFGGPGVSAHLLILESEGAYHGEIGRNKSQEAGYALEERSASSSALSNPVWAPSLEEYCTQSLVEPLSLTRKEGKETRQSEHKDNDELDAEESVSIEAFMAGPARKRQRGEDGKIEINDILNSESSSKPRKSKKKPASKPEKNVSRALKTLREIVGREGLGPLNYRELAEKIEVPLNILEFFQASPDAAKEFRRIEDDSDIVFSSYSLNAGGIVNQKFAGTFDARWDLKNRPTSIVKSRGKRRQKSSIRASIMGLEHNQATHPSIHDVIPKGEDSVEQFPTDRRPERRAIEEVDEETLEAWFASTGASLGKGIPNTLARIRVLKLLYTYRDLNATELEHIEPTDLFQHKVRLKAGVEPWRRSHQRRWPVGQEYWLQKTVREGLECGMYERTVLANGELSSWNAQPVLVPKDKTNTDPWAEMRVTFNYRNIEEDLPGCFLELMSKTHDYLSQPQHNLFCVFDVKNGYWCIPIYKPHRHYFAFSISGIGQCQPTRMPQGTRSAGFSFTEMMYIALGSIPPLNSVNIENPDGSGLWGNYDGSEPSLISAETPGGLPRATFYIDDIFSGATDFEDMFNFLEYHLFPRLAWAKLKLSFKKIKLFVHEVLALGIVHKAGGQLQIKEDRARLIRDWRVPRSVGEVSSFLGAIGITRRWVKNFAEIARPLSRLTGKTEWVWGPAEQVSFELLREKCSTTIEMFGYEFDQPVNLYSDASKFAGGCCITQRRGEKGIEVPILYDSFTFSPTQRNYGTYKRELCAIVEFCRKFEYMLRSLSFTSIIWTDHQPIARFLDSIHHEGIYARWCSELRSLNIEIKYIQGVRNVVADALSRTLFEETYDGIPSLEELGRMDETGQPKWIWKDGKDGYQELLSKIAEPIRTSELDKLMCCSGSVNYMQLGIRLTKPDQVFLDLCAIGKG
ncbi:hypothetical protein K3495_g12690, partial [Podosphaera aphanis]